MKIQSISKGDSLLDVNKVITLSGESAIEALTEVECIMISLKIIARHYYDNVEDPRDIDPVAYAVEVAKFLSGNRMGGKLAKIRTIISGRFDKSLGPDGMSDTERAMEHIGVWRKPGD